MGKEIFMIKSLAIAAALVGGALIAAPAGAAPLGAAAGPLASSAQTGNDLVETVQYRRYGYGRGYYGPRYGYRGGYYRGGRGAAIGAGVAAGAVGALAAGALLARPYYAEPAPVYVAPPPVYDAPDADAIAYCSRRFRSYDPETGTYIASGGVVRACP
jgi:hypothetical protein